MNKERSWKRCLITKNNFYKFYNVDYIFNSYSSRRLGSPNFWFDSLYYWGQRNESILCTRKSDICTTEKYKWDFSRRYYYILWKFRKKISTRRVIAVENNHEDFYTKADTKTYIEPGVVKKRNIIGSPIFQIPYIGLVLSKTAFAWIQGLFFTIAFCLTGITAWNTFVELKKKRRRTQKFL